MRLRNQAFSAVWLTAGLWVLPPAAAQPIDLATVKPEQCAGPFKFEPGTKTCGPDSEKMAKITTSLQCEGVAGVVWRNGKCEFLQDKAPAPTCGSAIPDLIAVEGKCLVDRKVPRSAVGDYEGDCFRIIATPQPNDLGFERGDRLVVLSQIVEGDDRKLRVVKAERAGLGPLPIPYFCEAASPVYKEVRASQLAAAGAERLGWTYGVLAMPFKYYRHDKTFTAGAAIGPYVGRRSGAAGSAVTFAVAATIGSVKGELRDGAGAITSTPDLMAYSIAAGWMFDISKAQGVKPFKIGLFFGQDRVGSDNGVKFKQNGRGWVAFQIGFDFTDN